MFFEGSGGRVSQGTKGILQRKRRVYVEQKISKEWRDPTLEKKNFETALWRGVYDREQGARR